MKNIPVVLLNGGRGYYSEEFKDRVPKGAVSVVGKPLILHVIDHYMQNDFNEFIICDGIKADLSRERILSCLEGTSQEDSNFYTAKLNGRELSLRFISTGDENLTWDRIKAAKEYISTDYFALSYADTYSDINLKDAQEHFLNSGTLMSLAAVHFPVRFRVLGLVPGKENVQGFASKPVIQNDFINGGFYFIKKELFAHYESQTGVAFEQEILNDLVQNHSIYAYKFEGRWQHFDSTIDLQKIENILRDK